MRTVPPLCSSITDYKRGTDGTPITNENDPLAINRAPSIPLPVDQKGTTDKPPLRATSADVSKPTTYAKRYTRSSVGTTTRSSGRQEVAVQPVRSQTPHSTRGVGQPMLNNYLDEKKVSTTRTSNSTHRVLTRSNSMSQTAVESRTSCENVPLDDDNMEVEAEAGVEQMQHGFEQFCIEGTNSHPVAGEDMPMEVETRQGSSHPSSLATPVPDVAVHVRINRDLGTIETMHQTLNDFASDRHQSTGETNVNAAAPAVWVVRHVDYTAKYGLGFLLNTGAVGVYFNDSTKIVLSATGKYFQYIERRKCPRAAEHHSQCYSIASYPPELNKKVTLLKHFRNYLYEQQNNSGSGNVAGLMGPLAESDREIMSQAELNCVEDLPYIKKWVRTRHAILFRLSNRTVQVMFFDERYFTN